MEENKKVKKQIDWNKLLSNFKSKEVIQLAVISSPSGLRTRFNEHIKDLPKPEKRQLIALLEGAIEELK